MTRITCSITHSTRKQSIRVINAFNIKEGESYSPILSWYKENAPQYIDSSNLVAKNNYVVDKDLFFALFLGLTYKRAKEIKVSITKEYVYLSPYKKGQFEALLLEDDFITLLSKYRLRVNKIKGKYQKELSSNHLLFDDKSGQLKILCPYIQNTVALGYNAKTLSSIEQAILALLKEYGELNCQDISSQLSISPRTIRYNVKKLVDKNLVTPSSKFKTSPLQTYAPVKFSL